MLKSCLHLVSPACLASPHCLAASHLPIGLRRRYSWFTLAAFLATAAFWVRQSDRGLRYYPASLIMPLMQVWVCECGWGCLGTPPWVDCRLPPACPQMHS